MKDEVIRGRAAQRLWLRSTAGVNSWGSASLEPQEPELEGGGQKGDRRTDHAGLCWHHKDFGSYSVM